MGAHVLSQTPPDPDPTPALTYSHIHWCKWLLVMRSSPVPVPPISNHIYKHHALIVSGPNPFLNLQEPLAAYKFAWGKSACWMSIFTMKTPLFFYTFRNTITE